MMKSKNLDSAVYAENLAQTYSLLSTLLNQCPDVHLVKMLRDIGLDGFSVSSENQQDDGAIAAGLQQMQNFIEATVSLSEDEAQQQLAVDWTCLLRGVSPTYGPQPPYEGLFRPDVKDPLDAIKSVNRIYREMGVSTSDESSNRPDYIGTELGFMSYLLQQAADSYKASDIEAARQYEIKAEQFMHEHLGLWVGKYIEAALKYAKTDFYRGLLQIIESVCRQNLIQK